MSLPSSCVIFILLLGLIPVGVSAQEPGLVNTNTSGHIECTEQFFSNIQNNYKLRAYRQTASRVAKNLQKILERCPDSSHEAIIRSELTTLGEEYADHSLLLAKYYLKVFQEKGIGLKGSQSRLRLIEEKVPKYSKLDEVLFLLGETYVFENNVEEAEKYFRRTITKFPKSRFRKEAKAALKKVKQNRKRLPKNT